MRTPRICSLRKNNSLIQSPENIKHVKFKYIYSEDKEGAVKKKNKEDNQGWRLVLLLKK